MNRSLIFASIFPPDATSAGIRCGKLARAAVYAGIPVRFVHAAESERGYEWRDGVQCATFGAPVASWLLSRSTASAAGGSARSRIGAILTWPLRRFARAMLQPDEYVLESRRFSSAIDRAVREERAKGHDPIVLACAPPWSTTIAARSAARQSGAPLVIDFQDLWSTNPVARWPHVSGGIARGLERSMFKDAAGFVFINDRVAARYRAAHPSAASKPSAIAHIGADHPPQAPMHAGPTRTLELLHIGSIYGDRDLAPLLDACVSLRRGGHDVRLTWYGGILGDHPLRASIDRYEKAGVLEMRGIIPHEQARQRMRDAHLLVAVPSPAYVEELTGKLFDYIDAGRPVLALAHADSYIAEVLREGGIGSTIDPADSKAIETFLARIARDGISYQPVSAVLERFTPPAIGAALAMLVKALR